MKLIYILDPMCSWCWAFAPVIDKLKETYPEIPVLSVMGGLAPDSDEPMPAQLQQTIQSTWQTISERTGTTFNHNFWKNCQPRRSTYPACRAVLAAENLKGNFGSKMTLAIQRAYYLYAQNPSDSSTLINLAVELGLDKEQFSSLLNSTEIEQQLQQHLAFAQKLAAQGFPSLYLVTDKETIPISQGYQRWETLEKKLKEEMKRG